MQKELFIKGRGAQINPANPFQNFNSDRAFRFHTGEDGKKTKFIIVHPKTIVNKVDSPDIKFDYSLNPYQGCEHGCVYCYARNTHTFWGYSAGLDFESTILVKQSAPKLLSELLSKKNWMGTPIMISGNTDCYQPLESKFKITRKILKVLCRFRHGAGIITKNSLLLRDMDLLKELAEQNLIRVVISITTLDEKLRQMLEPRTSTVQQRLHTVKELKRNKIPVNVMMAPVIPGLTDYEIFSVAEQVAEAGANGIYYTILRLNGDVAEIFSDWLEKTFPDRRQKIMNLTAEVHGGTVNDSDFGKRMRGVGEYAAMIKEQFEIARSKYFDSTALAPVSAELYGKFKYPQQKLF